MAPGIHPGFPLPRSAALWYLSTLGKKPDGTRKNQITKDREMNYTKSKLTRGYAGQVLNIDLGSGTIATPSLDSRVRDYFLGGRSLGLYLLHRAISPATR